MGALRRGKMRWGGRGWLRQGGKSVRHGRGSTRMSHEAKTAEQEAADRSGEHGPDLKCLLHAVAAPVTRWARGLPPAARTGRSFLRGAGQTALVATMVS